MTRGRPRDEAARERVLAAAFSLAGDSSTGRVGVNDIAASANVAKQTIYRWWPSRTAVLLDALVTGTMRATVFPETRNVRRDFETHVGSVITLFASPTGSVIRELLSNSLAEPAIAAEFRDRFWQPRRELSRARLERGIRLRQVRADVDPERVLDAIYSPVWTRLIVGHAPLEPADAKRIVAAVWDGIATTPTRTA